MAHDDPFTIDLFGNTALSSGLDLGVTAFAGIADNDQDDDPDPAPSAPGTSLRRSAKQPNPQQTSSSTATVDSPLAGRPGRATASPRSGSPPRSRSRSGRQLSKSRRI